MRMPKRYCATIKLGVSTTTCDYSGEPTCVAPWSGITGPDIDRVLPAFLGWRMQVPPKVSAVHVNGRRAHEMYRSGQDPDIAPRPVFIETIERVSGLSEEGECTLLIRCGKGTYIRSLARDIGSILGCGAHIAALRREHIGCFPLAGSLEADADFAFNRDDILRAILPICAIENFLPAYRCSDDEMKRLRNGLVVSFRDIRRYSFGRFAPRDALLCSSSSSALTVGHLEVCDGKGLLVPDINISAETVE